ncbi:MAG TPA: hypothetical protein VGI10_04260 [Polyangiaceae bacterium]
MTRRPRLWRAIGLVALSCASTSTRWASADEPPTASGVAAAEARSLFAEGRRLAAHGEYEQACSFFERSLQRNVGIGARFNLADCWERLGRTASAYQQFSLTADAAHAAAQPEREKVARERAALLEPKLSRLTVEVDASIPELTLTRDDAPLEPAAWGVAVAVDPGTHTVEASAPGHESWSTQIVVLAERAEVTVHVPALAASAPTRSPPLAGSSVRPAPAHAVHATDRESFRLRQPSIWTLSVAALGVSGLVAGTVFGLQYQADNDRAARICSAGVACSHDQITSHDSLVADARQTRNLSFVSFGLGAFALLGATALYLRDEGSPSKFAWTAEPVAAPDGSWGLRARGSF